MGLVNVGLVRGRIFCFILFCLKKRIAKDLATRLQTEHGNTHTHIKADVARNGVGAVSRYHEAVRSSRERLEEPGDHRSVRPGVGRPRHFTPGRCRDLDARSAGPSAYAKMRQTLRRILAVPRDPPLDP